MALLLDSVLDASGQTWGNLGPEIVAGIIVLLIGAVLTKFWNRFLMMKNAFLFLMLNVPARLSATSISKYKDKPESWLSVSIFDFIQSKLNSDKLFKLGIQERAISFKSQRMGIPITIWLEEEFDTSTLGSDEPIVLDYEVAVEMAAELRVGYREVSEFDDFVVLSKLIQDCVREKCFASATPYDNYAICSAKRDSKLARPSGRIDDSKLKVQVTIEDYGVEILSEEPLYLTRALKKYFPI